MERHVPEGVNQRVKHGWVKMQSIYDDDRKDVLHMVYETGVKTDNSCENEQKGRVDAQLLVERAGNLVFPHHVKVRFQTAEGKNKGNEKTQGADESELADGDVLGVFHDGDDGVNGPVQVQDV